MAEPMQVAEKDQTASLVFAYYVTGHGLGHATRVVEVSSTIYNLQNISFRTLEKNQTLSNQLVY